MSKKVYCHFSFRRKKGDDKIILACCLFMDTESKQQVARRVVQDFVWKKSDQYIGAIQAYQFALDSISKWQGQLISRDVQEVQLITDNSILAKWILNPDTNKNYRDYMRLATKDYKIFGSKELAIDVTLQEPRKYESSFKYCKPENIEEDRTAGRKQKDPLNKSKTEKSASKETSNAKHVFVVPSNMEKIAIDFDSAV